MKAHLHKCEKMIKTNSQYRCALLKSALIYEDDAWRALGIVIHLSNETIPKDALNKIEQEDKVEEIIFLKGYISGAYCRLLGN